MINGSKFVIVDFETNALDNNYNQPVSIGAVMIDARKLTICEQGTFYSLIKIIPDEEVEKYNLCKTEQKALEVNKLNLKDIMCAPPLKKVWGDFTSWMKFHTIKKDQWEAPIFCGHNKDYDKRIVDRVKDGHLNGQTVLSNKLLAKTKTAKASNEDLAKEYKSLTPYVEPWKFGPDWLFHPSISLDTMQLSFTLFENCKEPHRMSLSSIKSFLGFKDTGAHNALVDCLYSAEILVRYLKLMRNVYRDTNFDTGGVSVLEIESILAEKQKKDEECPF